MVHEAIASYMYSECFILSCPAGIGDAGNGMLPEFIDATGITLSQLTYYRDHPIDKMPLLLKNDIPIMLVYGGSDDVVPYHENGASSKSITAKTVGSLRRSENQIAVIIPTVLTIIRKS